MLAPSALGDMRPLFMTPCYGGTVTSNFVNSMLALNNALWQNGMQGGVRIRSGESLITRARNEAVAEFLADPHYTHLFWIDADIGFSVDQAMRLLLADHDVVAGVYPIKRFDWPDTLPAGLTRAEFAARYLRYPVNVHDNVSSEIDAEGFMEVSEAPTGFMCIKREAFTRMIEVLPELQYVPDGPPDSPLRNLCYRFFDVMVEPHTNRYLSEDYAFCRRWRDIGGRIFVDTQSQLSHQGIYTYHGDFGASLAASPMTAVGGQI
ncbi:hypothetical protein B0G80_3824 [Paraburkholderia sp. BL6669N2]|uniref:hypothetical protein n=1 Tax=unclassified Paraburkholderia TaxID=2615204 RepID=UPI000E25B5E9|nr:MULTISPECIES: hypothetical protein [unclassified Paraburkholderia]REG60998.1 hypothetical protein B0G80_3824 [Paraburkholderia sp. BL6669N2]TDY25208.1 hypothetical protein B0G81_5661 [Paraburkholderia sp. BL6665CI2N2]